MRTGKKRIRRLTGAFLSAILAGSCLGLTGCHGSQGLQAFTVPESFDDTKPVTITFWAKNDTNKNQTAVYHQAIQDFEALYPNISVNIKLYNDYKKIYNKVNTNMYTVKTTNIIIS